MEAVQRAREAVEVGRADLPRKRGIWSSSGDLKMVSLMEHAFVARQTAFASSRRSRAAFGESGSGRPQLAAALPLGNQPIYSVAQGRDGPISGSLIPADAPPIEAEILFR